MNPTAYGIASVAVMVFIGMSKRIEDLKAERNNALRALTRLRGGRLGDSETPCPDELALLACAALQPTHTDTEKSE